MASDSQWRRILHMNIDGSDAEIEYRNRRGATIRREPLVFRDRLIARVADDPDLMSRLAHFIDDEPKVALGRPLIRESGALFHDGVAGIRRRLCPLNSDGSGRHDIDNRDGPYGGECRDARAAEIPSSAQCDQAGGRANPLVQRRIS